jgi:hypothetical protein
VLHSREGTRIYSQILDLAGIACRGQILKLISNIVNNGCKKFYKIGPRSSRSGLYTFGFYFFCKRF